MTSNYRLVVAAYKRGVHWQTGKDKPYHWALFIRTGPIDKKDVGIAHQLHGMPGNFFYSGPEEVKDMSKSISKCLEVDIGSVPRTQLDTVSEVCSHVEIDQDENTEWNCQDWAIAAVKGLETQGFIDSWVDEAFLRGTLKEMDSY